MTEPLDEMHVSGGPLMCPHCGSLGPVDPETGLVPTHDWPKPMRQVCPGSGQKPRNAESDRRPLWNGQPNPWPLTEAEQLDLRPISGEHAVTPPE